MPINAKDVEWVEEPPMNFWEATFLPAVVDGLRATGHHVTHFKSVTQQYPEVASDLPKHYRGVHRLNRDDAGPYAERSRRSRASSTPPCDAASISMTSRLPGPVGARSVHDWQTPHGVGVGPCSQFSERARIRADDVLPHPRGPEKRYAWLIRPVRNACISGSVTCSCPMTSENVRGRYLR